MAGQPPSRGRLTLNVAEASGRTHEEQVVWDQSFVEGFVKVEVRGDAKTVKVASRPRRIISHSINWNEDLALDVLEGAKELRLMLCREKRTEARTSTSVVAACGIFIEDILNAVPIDKYFELFKPGAAGPGGFIRISMNFEAAATTPYHSPEDMRSAHSGVSDTSYQDLSIDGRSGRTTPRDYDDNDSAARRITEEAFEGSLGDTENGDAASHAAAAEEIESHPSPAQDGKPQKTSPSSDGANKPAAKHGLQLVLLAGVVAAGVFAFRTFAERQQSANNKK